MPALGIIGNEMEKQLSRYMETTIWGIGMLNFLVFGCSCAARRIFKVGFKKKSPQQGCCCLRDSLCRLHIVALSPA